MSVDEIMATLKRSSLPTVLIEGQDDVVVYRQLESIYDAYGISVLPVGGRSSLLEIFRRRQELPEGRLVCFLSDLDTWIVAGIPQEFIAPDLIFTDGYSIENDALSDINAEQMLTIAEREVFRQELERFCRWYSLALSRHLSGKNVPFDLHPNYILDDNDRYDLFTHLDDDEVYPQVLFERIFANYKRELRGKSLTGLLLRQLSTAGRGTRHQSQALLEMASVRGGQYISRIFEAVGNVLNCALPA
jgi:hypothetical protein